MVRQLIASLVGAVVLFFTGFFAWAIFADKLGVAEVLPADKYDAYKEAVGTLFPNSGMYIVPTMSTDSKPEDLEVAMKRLEAGPYVKAMVLKNGAGSGAQMKSMGLGFIHMWIMALFATVLLGCTKCQNSYVGRVGFVFGLGVFAASWTEGCNIIWWFHDLKFSLYNMGYLAIGWLFAGLAMGAILRPGCCQTKLTQIDKS